MCVVSQPYWVCGCTSMLNGIDACYSHTYCTYMCTLYVVVHRWYIVCSYSVCDHIENHNCYCYASSTHQRLHCSSCKWECSLLLGHECTMYHGQAIREPPTGHLGALFSGWPVLFLPSLSLNTHPCTSTSTVYYFSMRALCKYSTGERMQTDSILYCVYKAIVHHEYWCCSHMYVCYMHSSSYVTTTVLVVAFQLIKCHTLPVGVGS